MSVVYPSVADILNLHRLSIQDTGGSAGVRDINLVESAAARPQQSFGDQELYPTLFA
ncbi:MAG: Fic family protein [Persicimonas sp.]